MSNWTAQNKNSTSWSSISKNTASWTEKPKENAGISFDAYTTGSNSGTSLTISHATGTSGNKYMLIFVAVHNGGGGDVVTGVTYNGVAATFLKSEDAFGETGYVFQLLNPSSGTNDCIISSSNSVDLEARVITYANVSQTSQPNTFSSSTGSGNFVSMTTTTENNCWIATLLLGLFGTNIGTAVSGITLRDAANAQMVFGDSNGAVPTGVNTQEVNAVFWIAVQVAFSPAL